MMSSFLFILCHFRMVSFFMLSSFSFTFLLIRFTFTFWLWFGWWILSLFLKMLLWFLYILLYLNLWRFWLFGNQIILMWNFRNGNWLRCRLWLRLWGIKYLFYRMAYIFTDLSNSVNCFLSFVDYIFSYVLNCMCSIYSNTFNSFCSIFSSMLNCIGKVLNKAKLWKDRCEEEWC